MNDVINEVVEAQSQDGQETQTTQETTQDNVNWEESAKYFQSEKDKLASENAKLQAQLNEAANMIVGKQQKAQPNRVSLTPEEFDPWEAYNNPESKSFKFRQQEMQDTIGQAVNQAVSGIKEEQTVSKIQSDLQARGFDGEQVDKFFEFFNTPVENLGMDNWVKMYNAVTEGPVQQGSPLDTIRDNQNRPQSAGVLQGQQPQVKSDEDSVWEGIMGQPGTTGRLP
jgi:hypothetical protein